MSSKTIDPRLVHVSLTPFDHLSPPVHPPGVAYFGIKPGVSYAQVFEHLKSGMYHTFKQYPILNGRVHAQAENTPGWRPGQLEIRYDSGIREPDCHQLRYNEIKSPPNYEELKAQGFPMDSFEDSALSFVSVSYGKHNLEAGMDIVAAQANFIPGACLLATSVHHSAADAAGMGIFWKLWSDACWSLSEVTQGRTITEPVVSPAAETWDRTILETIWQKEKTGRSIDQVSDVSWKLIGLNPPAPGENGLASKYFIKPPMRKEKMTSKQFYMSPKSYNELQRNTEKHLEANKCSGNDLIQALIWCCLLKARTAAKLHTEPTIDMDQEVELQVVHDARTAFSSSMPAMYAGNCVVHHRPKIPLKAAIGDLSSVAQVAQAIRKSAREVNHENILDAYMLVRSMPDWQGLRTPRYTAMDNTWLMSSMLLLPEGTTSFGDNVFTNGGRLEGSHHLVGNRNAAQVAACYILPRKKSGGIQFTVSLFEDEWPHLLQDKEFARYAYLLT